MMEPVGRRLSGPPEVESTFAECYLHTLARSLRNDQGNLYPMALFSAYLDESENAMEDGKFRVFTIGGYVAFAHDFAGLARKWSAIVEERLKPLGLNRMHMAHFESKTKGFERVWERGDAYAHELLRDFVNVIHSCEIQPVAVNLPMTDWDALPVKLRDHYQTPFYPMMQAIIHKIAKREHITSSDGVEQFSFIFDSRQDVVRECGIAYDRLKVLDHFAGRLIGPPAFLSSKHVPELQAADILAYDVCKVFRNQLAGLPIIRHSTRMLTEKRDVQLAEIRMRIEDVPRADD